MPAVRAPDFRLPSVAAGEISLGALTATGPALPVFGAQGSPTSRLALRRLAAVVPARQADGGRVACVLEDPLPVAARVARDAGLRATVLSEPPPYATSAAYELISVPTVVLVSPDGSEAG